MNRSSKKNGNRVSFSASPTNAASSSRTSGVYIGTSRGNHKGNNESFNRMPSGEYLYTPNAYIAGPSYHPDNGSRIQGFEFTPNARNIPAAFFDFGSNGGLSTLPALYMQPRYEDYNDPENLTSVAIMTDEMFEGVISQAPIVPLVSPPPDFDIAEELQQVNPSAILGQWFSGIDTMLELSVHSRVQIETNPGVPELQLLHDTAMANISLIVHKIYFIYGPVTVVDNRQKPPRGPRQKYWSQYYVPVGQFSGN